jgi:hypothetical protein
MTKNNELPNQQGLDAPLVSGSAFSFGNYVLIENELLPETKGKIYRIIGFQKRFEAHFPLSDSVLSLAGINDIRTYDQFNEFIRPIAITEDWLNKLKQVRKHAKNKWWISVANLRAEIHIEFFKKEFIFSIQNDMGIFWLPEYKYIHELQNLCKSLTVELSLS